MRLPKEFVFFTYLLESYAQSRHTRAADVLAALDAQGRTEFVYDMYEMYHSEAIENAFRDIDSLIATGEPGLVGTADYFPTVIQAAAGPDKTV